MGKRQARHLASGELGERQGEWEGAGWLRFPPRCVITRHYPPIKSLSNNYLTVAVTRSPPLSPPLPPSLSPPSAPVRAFGFRLAPVRTPVATPAVPAGRCEPGLPAIKASPFLNRHWMTALATTVQG